MWLSEALVSQSRVLCEFVRSIAEEEVTAQVSVAVMFHTSIMQVPGSRLGLDTDYPDLVVGGFYYSLPNTVIPRLTKIIRSGITFVSRNLR